MKKKEEMVLAIVKELQMRQSDLQNETSWAFILVEERRVLNSEEINFNWDGIRYLK
jgi:hypothetical protein